jgi:outer membrane protein OmpA-like peptidoglycan-associated protein
MGKVFKIKRKTVNGSSGGDDRNSYDLDHDRGMGYNHIKFIILMIFLCFSIITGCAAIQGKLTKNYESEYHDTVQASSDTLKNLKIPVTEKKADELKTVMNAKRFDGTPVTIEVVRINQKLTEVSVRTGNGVVLDRSVSTQIHEFINESLIQQTKQGITEEDLDDNSGREIISAGTGSEYEDQTQAKGTRKLAGIFPDSVFVIYFNQDSNELTEKAKEKLDRVTEIIFKNPKVDITLNGYTDSIGAPSYNKMVSENRANVVKRYLIGKGVDSSKIQAIGYGPQNFLASNKTKEGRRFNRRVEIELIP